MRKFRNMAYLACGVLYQTPIKSFQIKRGCDILIWVMKMATRYQFSKEEIEQIRNTRKANKSKQVERRLRVLEMMSEGYKNKDIAERTGYHEAYLRKLVSKYREGGLGALIDNHYSGNHRNLSYEAEAALLATFNERAAAGEMVNTAEIKAAYEEAVGHSIGGGQIYYVLKRHKWRKVMPRSKHPKKASDEVIETSKKLTIESRN